MPYPEAAWERAMTVQEVMLKAISGEWHWYCLGAWLRVPGHTDVEPQIPEPR